MYITDFEIADLRCFHGKQVVSLDRGDGTYAGWTVFAGRNGSGKSTLLKALALACVGSRAAEALVGVFHQWVRRGAELARVSTTLTFDERDGASLSDPGTAVIKGLRWTSYAGRPDEVLPDSSEDEGPYAGPWVGGQGWFIAGYGPYRRLGPTTPNVERYSYNPQLDALVNLFFEDATLTDAVDWLKDIHARALEQREGAEQLRDDVLAIMADGLLPDGIIEKVDSDGLWVNRDGISLPLEQVSDGYRTIVAMVVDIVRHLHRNFGRLDLERAPEGHVVCKLPGVVLIDEVDVHMHVAWQQRIGFWLTSRFPRIQFLVTTHSPFICQAAGARGIIRLPAPGEPRVIEHVGDELFKAIVNGGADEAVMTELFGLEHAHSDEAESLRRQVAALEGRVLRGQASADELQRYERLRAELPSSLGEIARQRLRAVVQG